MVQGCFRGSSKNDNHSIAAFCTNIVFTLLIFAYVLHRAQSSTLNLLSTWLVNEKKKALANSRSLVAMQHIKY